MRCGSRGRFRTRMSAACTISAPLQLYPQRDTGLPVAGAEIARRYWPDALIAVTRLLSGGIRDPLVASNVLGGLLLNQCAAAISFLLTPFWPSKAPVEGPIVGTMIALENVSSFAGVFLFAIGIGATIAALLFFAFLVVRIWARRDWIATACLTMLAGSLALTGAVPGIAFSTINATAGMWMLRRLGVLSFLVSGAMMITGAMFSQVSHSAGS